MSNPHKGSSFDEFLEDEGIIDVAEATAVKRVIAHEVISAMEQSKLTKKDMANKMKTSRSALDRLLDPENTSVTLQTLVCAAHVLGKRLHISFKRAT